MLVRLFRSFENCCIQKFIYIFDIWNSECSNSCKLLPIIIGVMPLPVFQYLIYYMNSSEFSCLKCYSTWWFSSDCFMCQYFTSTCIFNFLCLLAEPIYCNLPIHIFLIMLREHNPLGFIIARSMILSSFSILVCVIR